MVGKPARKNRFEGLGVACVRGSINVGLVEVGWTCVRWIYPTPNSDWRRALVNTAMNVRVLVMRGVGGGCVSS